MSKIIDRTGKGSSISQAEFDANYDSLHGINQGLAGASHTVDITDQGDTLEFTNGGAVAVTLDDIATILGLAHTSDFKVTLISIGTGTVVTITPDGTDSINTGASTIVLSENQYVTIQTDSTTAIWNIIESSNARNLDGLAATSFLRSDADDSASGNIDFSGAIDLAGTWGINGTQVLATAAELNDLAGNAVDSADFTKLSQVSASSTELNYIDGSSPGVAVVNKALVLGASKNVDTIDVAKDGLEIGGVAMTCTAAELNQLDNFTPIGDSGFPTSGTTSGLTITSNLIVVHTISFASVSIGDLFFVNVHATGTKGATGGMVRLYLDGGIGAQPLRGASGNIHQTSCYQELSKVWYMGSSFVFRANGNGAATIRVSMESDGSDSSSATVGANTFTLFVPS